MVTAGTQGVYPELVVQPELHKMETPARGEETIGQEEDDPHLRSTREVIGYHIQAADGGIGHVQDFIVDDEEWAIRHMVVDTRNWLPGKSVVVSPQSIARVSWEERKIYVNLSREKIKEAPGFHASALISRQYESISSMIADLARDVPLARVSAREALVAIGGPAVPALTEALVNPSRHARWEAAKALGQIGDPAAAEALVRALEDEIFGVRRLAAEGLIALGREAVKPLLQALIEHSDSDWLRQGAHHVLHELARTGLEEVGPVLAALEDIEPPIDVPPAARIALDALK